jgi:hypothetical protein
MAGKVGKALWNKLRGKTVQCGGHKAELQNKCGAKTYYLVTDGKVLESRHKLDDKFNHTRSASYCRCSVGGYWISRRLDCA